MYRLPDAFREVWDIYEKRGAEMEVIDASPLSANVGDGDGVGDGGAGDGAAAGDLGGDGAPLDVNTLQARLRRRMRHSMHVLMQERNPNSYYRDIVHVEPT